MKTSNLIITALLVIVAFLLYKNRKKQTATVTPPPVETPVVEAENTNVVDAELILLTLENEILIADPVLEENTQSDMLGFQVGMANGNTPNELDILKTLQTN